MITMALSITGGLALAAIAVLIFGARVRFCLVAEFSAIRLKISVYALGRRPVGRVEYVFLWQDGCTYRNGRRLRPERRRKLRTGRIDAGVLLKAAYRGVRAEELSLYGSVGIRGDACLSVLLSGGVVELFGQLLNVISAGNGHVCILPAFDRDELCLNLEGILRIRPAQIICAAIRALRQAGKKAGRGGQITCGRESA